MQIAERVKQFFVPGQHRVLYERLQAAKFVDVTDLVIKYPLALLDARVIYPDMADVSDHEWACGALGFTTEMIGLLDAHYLLKHYPEIFLFSSYCCWGYYRRMNQDYAKDPYFVQRQYTTILHTLLAVGYSYDVCKEVIDQLHVAPESRVILIRDVQATALIGAKVVFPLNAEAQGVSVH